jgi:hypothetical protein
VIEDEISESAETVADSADLAQTLDTPSYGGNLADEDAEPTMAFDEAAAAEKTIPWARDSGGPRARPATDPSRTPTDVVRSLPKTATRSGASAGRRPGRSLYLLATTALALCALMIGAYFMTRDDGPTGSDAAGSETGGAERQVSEDGPTGSDAAGSETGGAERQVSEAAREDERTRGG